MYQPTDKSFTPGSYLSLGHVPQSCSLKGGHSYKFWFGLRQYMQTVSWYPFYMQLLMTFKCMFEMITTIRLPNKSFEWYKLIHHKILTPICLVKNSKWVWSGNTTITNRRQPRGIARKSRSIITRHQEDKLSKATSCLFPIKMIAILEWT